MKSVITSTLGVELARAEERICQGLKSFVAVGRELRRIRDEKLYRGSNDETFEVYVQRRWKMTKTHAYRFIQATDCYENVTKLGTSIMPESESQVRPMVSLPVPKQLVAWKEVITVSGGEQPTAAQVNSVVARMKGKKDPASKTKVTVTEKKLTVIGNTPVRTINIPMSLTVGSWAGLLLDKIEKEVADLGDDDDAVNYLLDSVRKAGEELLATAERNCRCSMAI